MRFKLPPPTREVPIALAVERPLRPERVYLMRFKVVDEVTGAEVHVARGVLVPAEVEALAAEIKVGSVYTGKVVSTKDFGAFIENAPGTDGMCHISELADGHVKSVEDVVKIGDEITVKVINVDDSGRIKLSRRAAMEGEGGDDGEGGGSDNRDDHPDGGASGDKERGGRRRRRRGGGGGQGDKSPDAVQSNS